MSGRVVRRAQAERDVIKHFVYLAEQADLDTARRFRNAVESACLLLSETPGLGVRRQFKNARLAHVRLWPVSGFDEFLIFYEPIEGGIRLVRLIHAKEDYWRVFGT